MTAAVPRAALERLIAQGREHGRLSPDQLQAELPIDSMQVEDIALFVFELESAGISVEPDAFGPSKASENLSSMNNITPSDQTKQTSFVRADTCISIAEQPKLPAAARPHGLISLPRNSRATHAIAIAGLATIILVGGSILLL